MSVPSKPSPIPRPSCSVSAAPSSSPPHASRCLLQSRDRLSSSRSGVWYYLWRVIWFGSGRTRCSTRWRRRRPMAATASTSPPARRPPPRPSASPSSSRWERDLISTLDLCLTRREVWVLLAWSGSWLSVPICCLIQANLRILVTGGAGFIGSHLVDKLMENEKHEVRAPRTRSRIISLLVLRDRAVGPNPFWWWPSRSHLSDNTRNWVGPDPRERDVSWR